MTDLNYKDITLKARCGSHDFAEARLHSLAATFVGKDQQTDEYFYVDIGKLKWRHGNIENLITHYERRVEDGAERTIVYRYDVDPTQEMIEELFSQFKHIGVVKKVRKIYSLTPLKIHLDHLPDDTRFIEIEAIDRINQFTTEELRALCLSMKEELQIPDSDLIATGYFTQ